MAPQEVSKGEEKDRQKMYKNAGKHEDLRRRRTECSVEIRKQKREDATMKRRNLVIDENDTGDESGVEGPQGPTMSLDEILKCLTSDPSIVDLRRSFEALRRHVSRDKNPPVEEVTRLNLVEAMISGLIVEDTKVQFEAAWALTNVVSGTTQQTLHAVEKGCLQPLIKLCYSEDVKITEQVAWALANITGDTAELRDHVIREGGLDALGHLTRKVKVLRVDFVRTLAWWYSNMCRHKNPQAPVKVLETLAHGLGILMNEEDHAVRQDAAWAFSYMTDGPDDQIILPFKVGALDSIVRGLESQREALVAPIIRILGNFATGADHLTQILIDKGYIEKYIPAILGSGRSVLMKETVWLVSNVFAGTRLQIEYMLNLNLLSQVLHVFAQGDSKCKFEASWCISNLVQGGSPEQIVCIVKDNGLHEIADGMRGTLHVETTVNILESLMGILNVAEISFHDKYTTILDEFEASGCLDIVEGLQQHESEHVYKKALDIIEKHWHESDEVVESEEHMNGEVAKGGFQF